MGLPSPEQASAWGGKMLVDREGAAIGTVTQIYSDNATGLPEWATIRLGEATVFLPLLDAVEADGQVRVQVKRDDVAKAPMVGPGRRITEQEEARLYQYYGIDYTPERSPERTAARGRSGPEPRRAAPAPCPHSGAGPARSRGGDDRGCGGHRRPRSPGGRAPVPGRERRRCSPVGGGCQGCEGGGRWAAARAARQAADAASAAAGATGRGSVTSRRRRRS